MADKSIVDLPQLSEVTDATLIPVYQPNSDNPAQKMPSSVFRNWAEDAVFPAAKTAQEAATVATGAKTAAQSALSGVQTAIKNIPAGSTPIVNDLTTGGATMALSAEQGKVLGQRPNPNLLDNWYFADPINQRGKTEYGAVQYGIDRWYNVNGYSKSSIGENGYTLTADGGSAYFIQFTSHKKPALVGKLLTLSALFADGTFAHGSKACPESGILNYFYAKGLGFRISGEATLQLNISAPAGASVTLKAIKLELGSVQTLAHQDANGNWVLNEIPDKNEELLKCCMSTVDPADDYANNKRTAAAMRAVASHLGYPADMTDLFEWCEKQTVGCQFAVNGVTVTNVPVFGQFYVGELAIGEGDFRVIRLKTSSGETYETVRANNGTSWLWMPWKQTATTDTALMRDGSNAMTGILSFNSKAHINQSGGSLYISAHNVSDTENRRMVRIASPAEVPNLTEALLFYNVVNGAPTPYHILHTGNKPSGSYTGNGSAASRTINTGGIGSVCVICDHSKLAFAICTPAGAIYKNANSNAITHLPNSAIKFENGVLTIATVDSAVNYNGATYNYQVL